MHPHCYSYLREESVETVHLLSLFDVGVVLGDALERELVHEVDGVRVVQVVLLGGREGGR